MTYECWYAIKQRNQTKPWYNLTMCQQMIINIEKVYFFKIENAAEYIWLTVGIE